MEEKDLPKGWKLIDFTKSCQVISLNGIKIKQKEYLENGKYPVVDQGQELIGGYSNSKDLLIEKEPPYIVFGDHTKIKKYINFKFVAGADGIKVLKPCEFYNPKLFYYFFSCIKIPDKGYARHFQFYKSSIIPLPPINVQNNLVLKIEELFSELDNGIEQLKTTKEQLEVYRQSVLNWAFEGKLTNENVKYGELPNGWEWKTFEDVCTKIGDIDHKMPKNIANGYPYVSTKDFTDDLKISFENVKFIAEKDYLELSRKIKPERGDIIFPRYGTIGKNILVDFDRKFLVSYSCAVVKPNHDIVDSKYIYFYSLSPAIRKEIRKYVVETTQANIGIGSIKKFIFPLPSLEEQHKIVQEIESRLSVCDKVEETIETALKQSESLRQSILKKAFEGKLI